LSNTTALEEKAKKLAEDIATALNTTVSNVLNVVTQLGDKLTGSLDQVVGVLIPLLAGVQGVLVTLVDNLGKVVSTAVVGLGDAVGQLVGGLGDLLGGLLGGGRN